MKTEREKDLEAAEWLAREAIAAKDRARAFEQSSLADLAAPTYVAAEAYRRAAQALRFRAEHEADIRAITAKRVTLYGVECWLPSSVAECVAEACKENIDGL